MFKILIVDDEIFTREGIIEHIPWERLGITEVRQAFDGINALEIASSYSPDILLTDVRMPRMDGIELSFKLRELYPSCEIIFMSGYSDKEYLKSAIKLKAVSYVEKPIDLDELQTSIENAVKSKSKEKKLNESIKTNIASELVSKNVNLNKLQELLGSEQFAVLNNANFTTLIISIINMNGASKETLLSNLESLIFKSGFNSLSCFKDEDQLVVHLYCANNKKYLVKNQYMDKLYLEISQCLEQYAKFFICVGNQVTGLNNVFKSYDSALQALNKAFFYNYGSIIYNDVNKSQIYKFNENVIANFYKYLSLEDKYQSILLIKRLSSEIKEHTNTPVNYIKDIYYRIFLQLIKFSSDRNIQLSEGSLSNQSPFERISTFSTIYELEEYLLDKIDELFDSLAEKNKNADPITNIIRYIHDNYNDTDLSLPKISKNTYLSSAYICKIFKEQTGTTINKYIAEYRLNKAKELLKEQNITINDIAAKVGYGDGNYFTKIFKKETGLTPSEYRKKYLL